jgi:hypothetical protein
VMQASRSRWHPTEGIRGGETSGPSRSTLLPAGTQTRKPV